MQMLSCPSNGVNIFLMKKLLKTTFFCKKKCVNGGKRFTLSCHLLRLWAVRSKLHICICTKKRSTAKCRCLFERDYFILI